jgi:hypothetical protein
VETYAAQMSAASAAGEPTPYPNGAVFIVVDARTRFDARLSDKGDMGMIQTLQMGAGLTSTALVNRASSATLAELIVRHSRDTEEAQTLREKIAQLETHGHVELHDRHDRPIRVVHLALSHLQDLKDLPFRSFHQSVNSIATYFNIAPSEAHNLIKAAQLLVEQKYEPQLLRLRHELQ